MRKAFLCATALWLVGCGSTTTYVKSDTTLGRVVVYRNGVAYFERYAEATGDSLKLNVPQDKVDDFLKSLTVVDAQTGEPAPVSYPSVGNGGTIDMKVSTARGGSGPRKLRVSYVTEAPSWKPSYRVVVGKDGKVNLQGWAIVDNTSGEDWKDVKLGVGASSAMSFRFDLKGLRLVERQTLRENTLFAEAPPIGGAAYGQPTSTPRIVADFSDDVLRRAEMEKPKVLVANESIVVPYGGGRDAGTGAAATRKKPADVRSGAATQANAGPSPMQQMAQSIQARPGSVVIEGYAAADDKDKMASSLDRANRLREQLVQNGVDPNKVIALAKGEQHGRNGGARVVEAPPAPPPVTEGAKSGVADPKTADGKPPSTEPIGTSHFESTAAMSVPKGTSAMVSILRGDTDGEVVYFFDPESPRGNTQFPFKTLRFKNPTDSALESGPVSVFGDGRFIGEGLAEPIPAKSVAFVPFALDRQIIVERKDAERDEIAKIITVQRGVFSTQIQHTRRATFTLFNRMPERATVYLRHTVAQGYSITKVKEAQKATEAGHLAGANLFRVEVEPNGKVDVLLEESTPVFRTTDIRTQEGRDLVRAYLSSAAVDGAIKGQVERLLKLNTDMVKIEQQIQTTHEEMAEYRQRMDELHQQVFTLKAVKTAGPLMAHLEKKLQEMSEKLSRATLDVVALQEKQMVARVEFQNGVGELTLEDKTRATAQR